MKALTILEPWASLVAHNEKQIETRSWATNYRGPLLIHASARLPKEGKVLCRNFAKLLGIEKYNGSWLYYLENKVGPFGMIIASCNLVNCIEITGIWEEFGEATLKGGMVIGNSEFWFGDYTPGRFAWLLEDIQPLKTPIPAKGQLGLWNFNGAVNQ